MSPFDDFCAMVETDQAPMNLGALLLFHVSEGEKSKFVEEVHRALNDRLPRSIVACRLQAAPDHYDSRAWFEDQRAIGTPFVG